MQTSLRGRGNKGRIDVLGMARVEVSNRWRDDGRGATGVDVLSQRPASCPRVGKQLKDEEGEWESRQAGGSWSHLGKVVCERVRQADGATLGVDVVVQREHEDGGQLSVRSRAAQPDSLRDQPHAAFDEVGREAWQLMRGAPG